AFREFEYPTPTSDLWGRPARTGAACGNRDRDPVPGGRGDPRRPPPSVRPQDGDRRL
ncbi:MAG: hypothetical protein AVDCRST_MAG10-661, partial [uncultured Acidimicrobiales bacterium]